MNFFIVTYDLHVSGQDYSGLLEKIKEGNGWAKLSESSYAVSTEKSPQQLLDILKANIDDNDRLYIVTISKPYTGWGDQEILDWLEKNLPTNRFW